MILAMIGSFGFLAAMSVGWAWLEARHERPADTTFPIEGQERLTG